MHDQALPTILMRALRIISKRTRMCAQCLVTSGDIVRPPHTHTQAHTTTRLLFKFTISRTRAARLIMHNIQRRAFAGATGPAPYFPSSSCSLIAAASNAGISGLPPSVYPGWPSAPFAVRPSAILCAHKMYVNISHAWFLQNIWTRTRRPRSSTTARSA